MVQRPTFLLLLGLIALTGMAFPAHAGTLLAPGDAIIAIDTDPPGSNSSYPDGEPPANVVDGTLGKYLNRGGAGSGFIVSPVSNSTIQSFILTTANDAEGRDPAAWELFGTNDAITSADNSAGLAENWTLIDMGSLTGAFALPSGRDTVGPVVPVTNASAYTSYRMVFPELKGDPLMQIAEAAFYETADGTGANVLAPGDPVLAIHQALFDSSYPAAEAPANTIDTTLDKYLNFGSVNSGFIVTPTSGPDVVRTFQITTANDSPERDPAGWALYGTDDPITSSDNSQGDNENWALIDEGTIALPEGRDTVGPYVPVDNDTAYASYRMVFTELRDASSANSMQIAEIQFYNQSIPEPSTLVLASLVLGLFGLAIRRRG